MKILSIIKHQSSIKIYYNDIWFNNIKSIILGDDLYRIDDIINSNWKINHNFHLEKYKRCLEDLPWLKFSEKNEKDIKFSNIFGEYIPLLSNHINHSLNMDDVAGNICNFLTQILIGDNISLAQKTLLVKFINNNNLPILKNGNFVAYKYLLKTPDGGFVDHYSRSIKQNIHDEIFMNKSDVDTNPEKHCAPGLHVGNNAYMSDLSFPDVHICLAEINPHDVIAIPIKDSNKIRVCKYKLIHSFSNRSSNSIMEGDFRNIDKEDFDFLKDIQIRDVENIKNKQINAFIEDKEVDDIEIVVKDLHNNNLPISQISKKVGISRRQVYKILGKKY